MAIVIPRQYTAVAVANEQLTPKIYWLRVRTPEPIDYTAGQYASFLIDAARRPLSFATPAGQPELEFVIDVSPDGIASRYTKTLTTGDHIIFLAPYGRFTLPQPPPRPLVFIASGSGIAPIRAQILSELARGSSTSLTLVFGNRSETHMFFADELAALADNNPSFTFIPCCSEPGSLWRGERGLVTDVTEQKVSHLIESDVYVCGGPAMVNAALTMLDRVGVPQEQTHTEKFI